MPEPVFHSDSSPAAARWLGLTAVAVAIALAAAVGEVVTDPAREWTAVPGGVAWGAVLVGVLAGVSIGLLTRTGRTRVRRSLALGAGFGVVVAAGAVGYGIAMGPTAQIAGCSVPAAAAAGTVDARARLDRRAFDRLSGVPADGGTVARQLAAQQGAPIEDHGVERVNGADARHCSVLVSGDQALAAFPPLSTLSGDIDRPLGELPMWRGELRWWTDADGRLVLARVLVGGHPADAWGGHGLRGELEAEFRPLAEQGG